MADLYVCPTCGETEDCACHELAAARRALFLAEVEVRQKLGWLVVRLVQRMPNNCPACRVHVHCELCTAVAEAKKMIEAVLAPGGRT